MKTRELLNTLKENGQKELLFEYKEGKFVAANYHITEVKNSAIKSVDCGARSDTWNETIIQLWESPNEIGKRDFMKAEKALSILEQTDKIYKMDKEAAVLFEYSNDHFHKANLEIHDIELTSEKIIFKLFVSQTDCKAKDECGVKATVEPIEEIACCDQSGCC